MEATKGKTIHGGTGNPETLFATPTIIVDVPNDDPLVRTEIFGPILPILTYSTSISLQTLLRTLSPSVLAF
jgi:aldehyde dehydrogenase (NAD+)